MALVGTTTASGGARAGDLVAADFRVALFALAISLATGIAFGLVPALQAARPELAPTLITHRFPLSETVRAFEVAAQLFEQAFACRAL